MARRIGSGFWVMVLLVAAAVPAQGDREHRRTPPQKLFDWTRPDFGADEYRVRRAALMARLQASGGGILLVPSAEGTSVGETFRQRDDFHYLTGLELRRSLLAIDADEGTVTLFVPSNDPSFHNPARRNDFPGRPLFSDPALKANTGIADLRRASALGASLRDWAAAGRGVRVNLGRPGAITRKPLAPISTGPPREALLDELERGWPSLAVTNAFEDLAAVRMVKSPAEIAVLRRAAEITAEGIRVAAGAIRDGVDERSLEGVLEHAFKVRGSQRVAFASIIKSGPNSLWPWRILAAHYDRRNRAMRAGELVIFDVGCELDHYASDVGRTFPVSGAFDPRQRELVQMVNAVSDAVIAATRPGTTLAALQKVAIAAIPADERRYMQAGLFFGHHVGLAVGDPSLAHVPLGPGMVFTVEPWYYNHDEDVAVFVEDMVLVTADGADNLTASLPRAPDALAAMVGGGERGGELRILAYNIRHGAGMDGKVDLERIAAVINAQHPDVVALQEVDQGVRRTGGIEQARRLGALTGMHAEFGAFMDYQGGRYGMALLTRHPVVLTVNHRLPDGAEPRSALTAHLRIGGARRPLVVAGIHLYATDEERLAQARRLTEIFAEEEAPVILAGDFNSLPGSAVMEALATRWRAAGKTGAGLTFPADKPDREIDFIMLPADGPFEVVECRVIQEPMASDHRPVLVVLRWR